MTGRYALITKSLVEVLAEWDCDLEEAKGLLADAAGEYEGYLEQQYERQQAALRESGGPDDTTYRRDMKNAGRGHLLS